MLNELVKVTERTSAWWSDRLAELAQQREQPLFMSLYDHFSPKVNTYLTRLGASAVIAEELTQETMLTIWRKAQLYKREKAAASTWIFTIARNHYIDSVRRQTVALAPAIDEQHPDPQAAEPADLADGVPLLRALRTLPIMQSEVIYKSYFEGKSHSEIAADLNIPLGSVKSNIRLAFQKLRARMRPETEI